ncbi:hypothetical protein MRX96_003527 [Rhipicephalus microplus]
MKNTGSLYPAVAVKSPRNGDRPKQAHARARQPVITASPGTFSPGQRAAGARTLSTAVEAAAEADEVRGASLATTTPRRADRMHTARATSREFVADAAAWEDDGSA